MILGFIQDILLVKTGLASKPFEESLDNKLNINCDNLETIEALKKLAFNWPKNVP